MIKLKYVLLAVFILQCLVHCKRPRKMNAVKVARSINRSKDSTWKAKTYGMEEVNLDEFAKIKLGLKMNDPRLSELRKNQKKTAPISDQNSATVPGNFSWTATNLTTCPINIIRDQSNCGSCWAVATSTVLGDRICLAKNGTYRTPMSYEHLVGCNERNSACDGGYMSYAFSYLRENGTVSGDDYDSDMGCQMYSIKPCGPFYFSMPCDRPVAMKPKCKAKKCNNDWYKDKEEKKTFKITDYRWVNAYYYESIAEREIYQNGPIIALFWVYPDFMLYSGGIYTRKYGQYPMGGHAVRIVGWGIENGTRYWQVANSWGKNWGENGYFRIRKGTNECSIEYNMYAITPNITDISNS